MQKTTAWQMELANAITEPQTLLQLLELDAGLLTPAQQASSVFGLRVPRSFVARMQKGDPYDPLLRQVLPLGEELHEAAGFISDPLQESKTNLVTGLLHKFEGRVLLIAAGSCAINCRYCFRREFPYADNNPGTKGWEKPLAYISNDTSIKEVILSGGDPLLLKDSQLQNLMTQIAAIPHVLRLRIHTRLPVVIPERITDELIEFISQTRLQPIVVLHINHAREIDAHVAAAVLKLRQANIIVLNQAVLLRGVNDSTEALINLSESLFAAGILPYYLHLLDQVRGTAHFAVDEVKAIVLWQQLNSKLSGYLVPKLVREIPGAPAKVMVV